MTRWRRSETRPQTLVLRFGRCRFVLLRFVLLRFVPLNHLRCHLIIGGEPIDQLGLFVAHLDKPLRTKSVLGQAIEQFVLGVRAEREPERFLASSDAPLACRHKILQAIAKDFLSQADFPPDCSTVSSSPSA